MYMINQVIENTLQNWRGGIQLVSSRQQHPPGFGGTGSYTMQRNTRGSNPQGKTEDTTMEKMASKKCLQVSYLCCVFMVAN